MLGRRILALPALCGVLSATVALGSDLSTYRKFKLGTNLSGVARATRTDPSQVKTIHQRPALIQEIEWSPSLFEGSPDEAVRDVDFSFYNGALYQIAVSYDRYRTEGMRSEDLIQAISAAYGPATETVPAPKADSPDPYKIDSTEPIARWGDGESTLTLVRFDYGPSFGLVLISNRLGALAQAAVVEAARLDLQDAPQREAERLKKQADADRVVQEKARLENKPKFRL